jgi:hypothetical protein
MFCPSLCRTSNSRILKPTRTTPFMSMHRDSPLCNPGDCRQRGQKGQGIPKPQNVLQSFSKQTADFNANKISYGIRRHFSQYPSK